MSIPKYRKTYLILLAAFLVGPLLQAQQTNFIHIQSEANQVFAVQLNGVAYSSSATGYLVIPQVPVGEHTLIVGFARNTFPEYSFQCTIADKPRGFSLKQGVDNSWTLFDMVDFTAIRGALAAKDVVKEPEKKAPEPVIEKPIETVVVKPIEGNNGKKDNSTAALSTPSFTAEIPKAVGVLSATAVTGSIVSKSKPATTVSKVQKIFDKTSNSGIDQVYIVINRGKADTVALFIPILKEESLKQEAILKKLIHIPAEKESKADLTGLFYTQASRLQIPSTK